MQPAPRRSLLIFLLGCVLYAGSLGNSFHLDDFHHVVDNPHLRDLSHLGSYFVDPTAFSVNPRSAMYRPLVLTSFAVDHALFGDRPAGYHAVNVVLHALTGVLVYTVAGQLALAPAAPAAVLFLVHPVNSEAVNYISSRSELLVALLLLACLSLWLRARAAGRSVLPAVVPAAASVLAKSVGVVAPGLVLLSDLVTGGWRRARRWPSYLPVVAVSLAYAVAVRRLAARALVAAPVRPLAAQLWTQCKAHVYYVDLVALPVRLNVEHQFAPARALDAPVLLAATLLVSLAAVSVGLWRRLPWLGFAAAWWALVLLPVTVVPLIVLVNEHRLYLACLGVLLGVTWCLRRLDIGRRPGVAAWVTGTYLCLLAVLAVQRTAIWKDERTLWADAAAKAPAMVRPHLRLADALARAGRLEAARAAYLQALELRPRHPAVRNNLGQLYQRLGRWQKAEAQYRFVIRVSPDNLPARMNLAELLLRRGRVKAARAQYLAALEYGDTGGRAQLRLGQIALRAGAPAAALKWFEAAQAAGRAGDVEVHIARAVALRGLGRVAAALRAYERALELAPERSDAWYNLGNLLVEEGRLMAARKAFARVVDIGDDPELARRARQRLDQIDRDTQDP